MYFWQRIWMPIYWFFYSLTLSKDEKNDFKKLTHALDTREKVMAWLFTNIKYTSDKHTWDEWQPAERTFERRAGDCEDWAVFANACLRTRVMGNYICMYTDTTGHCEYLIDDGDFNWTTIGTYGLNRHHGTLAQIVPDWSGFENWTLAMILDEDLNIVEVAGR